MYYIIPRFIPFIDNNKILTLVLFLSDHVPNP